MINESKVSDEQYPIYEVTDEDIERAVFTSQGAAGAVTLSFCSGLDTCPA
jgi:ABC-type cobalt transport system substrate-binding protein